jgi:hypothetical protein
MPMSSDIVLGLFLPISSMKSDQRSSSTKASIARSSEMSSTEFYIMLQHCIYEHNDSPLFCVQAFSSSIDVDRV